jgi:hypothetical protein
VVTADTLDVKEGTVVVVVVLVLIAVRAIPVSADAGGFTALAALSDAPERHPATSTTTRRSTRPVPPG